MGYAEDFLCVKQFEKLYNECMEAGKCFEAGERKKVTPHVNAAFDEMKQILIDKAGSAEAVFGWDATFLSDLSRRNYDMYCTQYKDNEDAWDALRNSEVGEEDINAGNNAFYALQEEVTKFAQYYVRGTKPNAISEISSGANDGYHLSRTGRKVSDIAFGLMFSGGMLLVGIILLGISLIGQRQELMMTGLVFIVFAALLVGLRFVKK